MKFLILISLIILASCQGNDNGSSSSSSKSPSPKTLIEVPEEEVFENTVMLEIGTYKSECFWVNGEIHGYQIVVDNYDLEIMYTNSQNNIECNNNFEYMVSATFNINGDQYDFLETTFSTIFNGTKTLCNLPIVNYSQSMDGIGCSESYENKDVKFIQEENGDITFNGIVLNKV